MKYKRFFGFMLCIVASCYEGWNPPVEKDQSKNKKNTDNNPKDVPKPPERKEIDLIQVQFILPSDAAIEKKACGISEARKNAKTEWRSRAKLIKEKLESISIALTADFIEISEDDCTNFDSITTRAQANSPTDLNLPRVEGKIAHLVIVFWDGEPTKILPNVSVLEQDWKGIRDLKSSGFEIKSLRYFSIPETGEGYFHTWRASQGRKAFSAKYFNPNDPSLASFNSRTQEAEKDAEAFKLWVLKQN